LEEGVFRINKNENHRLLKVVADKLKETVSYATKGAKIKNIEPSKMEAFN
jgi:hypothetical protein